MAFAHTSRMKHAAWKSPLGATSLLAVLGLTSVLIGGCSGSVPIRSPGVVVGGQGNRSELVFSAPEVQATNEAGTGWELVRLEQRMYVRGPETAYSQAFDQPRRPSLRSARRLYLNDRRADQFIYFERDAGTRSAPWNSGTALWQGW